MDTKIYEKKQKHKITLVEFLLFIAFLGVVLNIIINVYDDLIHSRQLDKLSNDRYDQMRDTTNIDINYVVKNFDFTGDWYCPGYPKQYCISICSINSKQYQFSVIVYYKKMRYIKRYGNIEDGIMILNKPAERRGEYFLRLIPVAFRGKHYLLPSTKYRQYILVKDQEPDEAIDEMLFLLLCREPVELSNL
jgi:hypothetical protein